MCYSLHRQYILCPKFPSKLLLPQKLHCLNNSRPGGGRVHSLQPHLQHPNKALVRVTLVLCSDGLHGGHGQVEVDANEFPLVCHCVVEGIHQVFHFWCWSCVYKELGLRWLRLGGAATIRTACIVGYDTSSTHPSLIYIHHLTLHGIIIDINMGIHIVKYQIPVTVQGYLVL